MSEGRMQTVMEIWPIGRHLEVFKDKTPNSMCYFIAPTIFRDSERQIDYLKKEENLFVIGKTIEDFIQNLETSPKLYLTN